MIKTTFLKSEFTEMIKDFIAGSLWWVPNITKLAEHIKFLDELDDNIDQIAKDNKWGCSPLDLVISLTEEYKQKFELYRSFSLFQLYLHLFSMGAREVSLKNANLLPKTFEFFTNFDCLLVKPDFLSLKSLEVKTGYTKFIEQYTKFIEKRLKVFINSFEDLSDIYDTHLYRILVEDSSKLNDEDKSYVKLLHNKMPSVLVIFKHDSDGNLVFDEDHMLELSTLALQAHGEYGDAFVDFGEYQAIVEYGFTPSVDLTGSSIDA